jgi:hypothetical protein
LKQLFLTKKKPREKNLGALNLNLAVPNLPVRYQTSTFGVASLTSVFGMGTGVTLQLYPPGIFYDSNVKIFPCVEIFATYFPKKPLSEIN